MTGDQLPTIVARNTFVYELAPKMAAAGLDLNLLLTLPPVVGAPAARPPPQMPAMPQQQPREPSVRMPMPRSRSPPPVPPRNVPAWGVGPFRAGSAVIYKQIMREDGKPPTERYRPGRIRSVRNFPP